MAAEGNFEMFFSSGYQIGPIGLLKTEGGCSYKTSRRQPCCREPATEKALLTNTPGIHAPDRADYAAQAQTQALKPAPPPCNFGSDREMRLAWSKLKVCVCVCVGGGGISPQV